ncbi:serine hydrolase domain-containing protein [Kordiimonas gwangyangensis]|uniref:serine hydrolase domain-containing protein n=1 Tax=Kordiimonas gwangyangensis TaxID=288022 RepID=UPI00037593A5|nr:serine hydrolase domain-containing protein [Kordiimonas gwangyangensis]
MTHLLLRRGAFALAAAMTFTHISVASDDFTKPLDAFMDAQDESPLAPPSYSLVVANGEKVLYSRLKGERVLGSGDALTMDHRLYIASVSKSFTGLLAAKLDADGVLSLDATLKDEWPSLDLPAPIDASKITMRMLLSHNFGFECDPLVVRTAYLGDTPVADYEAILEQHSVPIEPGFSYDNLGYLIYAAVLERKTGRSWQSWLASDIHMPLGLSTATNVPSEIPEGEIALGYHYSPLDKAGWAEAPAKADDLVHPAGGHFISSADAVRWLQANMTHAVLEGEIYEVAQTAYAKREPAKKYADMSCDGYGLGWQNCDYAGHRVFYHGGTYDGMMIFMMFLPDDNLAVASINRARAFGWTYGWNASQQAIDYVLGLADADKNAERRLDGRVASHVRYAQFRARIREDALHDAARPEAAALRAALPGQYSSPAYGAATVCDADGKLVFKAGRFSAELLAGTGGKGYMLERAYGEPSKVEMTLASDSKVTFKWEGGTFERTGDAACLGEKEQSR